ncbi:MAG: hypothetical protein WA840_19675 [Caulobacteraceae bacterium]
MQTLNTVAAGFGRAKLQPIRQGLSAGLDGTGPAEKASRFIVLQL